MAKLIYLSTMSLDGYTEDPEGKFDFGAPSEEVFAWINGLLRSIGTYLFGRRMYETMLYWEAIDDTEQSGSDADFIRIWRASDKVVYSKTLADVSSARTRLERTFDPKAVQQMKSDAPRDLSVGGPELAGQAMSAGLIDELWLFVVPILLGGGKRALPPDVRIDLELLDQRRFENGTTYHRYRLMR